ncbi:MAG: hypothetical protein M9921_11065 [Fimbriimonadaceae bacterium]|nr:hypothetical protein [Chthonomonadaceae bacterium]MCO5297388.1 hypothetical protein [Fimbriimonadaceae bacterium]
MLRTLCLSLALAALLAGCQPPEQKTSTAQPAQTPADQSKPMQATTDAPVFWQARLNAVLPEFGHRNWIVVADSAFPTYTDPAIETVVTNEDHVTVVEAAMKAINASIHVRPVIYLDKELEAVPDSSAPGADAFRAKFDELRAGADVTRILHEELLAKLAQVGKTYKILVLKTNGVVPYTTVFMELNAKYWSASQEAALREALGQKPPTAVPKPGDAANKTPAKL